MTDAVTHAEVSVETLRHKRRNVLNEETERSVICSVGKTSANVSDIREVASGVVEAKLLPLRSNSFVVELGAERDRVIACHASAGLRLVAVRASQIKFVGNLRAQALRVVDALRATVVALAVEGEDRGD